MKKIAKKKLELKGLVLRDLATVVGGYNEQTGGAACPRSAYPPCDTVAGACSGIPYTCTLWSVGCTGPNSCGCPDYPF